MGVTESEFLREVHSLSYVEKMLLLKILRAENVAQDERSQEQLERPQIDDAPERGAAR